MKTPEELAEEYNKQLEQVPIMYYLPTEPCRKAFLAGYQAAKDQQEKEYRELVSKSKVAMQTLNDQLADVGKVIISK